MAEAKRKFKGDDVLRAWGRCHEQYRQCAGQIHGAELGWGFKSLVKKVGGVAKGVVKKTVVAPTKFVTQKTLIEPTKIVAKSTGRMVTGTASAAGKLVKGDVTGAGKSFVKASLEPVRGGAELTKQQAKAAYQASKAVTDLALSPIRSKLNTLKNRRANLLAWTRRKSKVPTTAEKAQARKDVKSMLSSKGPHGKMLAWLAGPPSTSALGEFGVIGYDDAALAAIATALTASLVKIISDAAKSKFAPTDAAKAGAAAGLTSVAAKVAPVDAQKARPAAEMPPEEAPAAEPVTQEEVAAEPAAEAEEAATEEETSNVEGALDGFGMLQGFSGVAEEAAAPAAMKEDTAKAVGSAAQRIVCAMSAPALNAIGGVSAVKVAGSLCQAVSAGDDATVRRLLPSAVQIAARASNVFASEAFRLGYMQAGGMPSSGFGGPLEDLKRRRGKKGAMKRYLELSGIRGVTADDLGMVAAFAGSDPESLSFGLAGVDSADLRAGVDAAKGSSLLLAPVIFVAVAGLFIALRD